MTNIIDFKEYKVNVPIKPNVEKILYRAQEISRAKKGLKVVKLQLKNGTAIQKC